MYLILNTFINVNAKTTADSTKTPVKVDSIDYVFAESELKDPIYFKVNDKKIIDFKHKRMYLYNKAEVTYGAINLKAYYIMMEFGNKEIFARGRLDSSGNYIDAPILKDGDKEYRADSMRYNFKTKRAKIFGAKMQEGDGYLQAHQIYRDSSGAIFGDHGKYSTCDLDHPHFYLKTRKIKMIPNDKIVVGPSNLVIEDIPTPLALPFGIFPIKKEKRSGLLFPTFGQEFNRGYAIRQLGYYFAISDYYDLSLKGDFFFNGSWNLVANTNYNKRYKYDGFFNVGYGSTIFNRPEDDNYSSSKLINVKWNHNQNAKARPGTNFSANVDIATPAYKKNNELNIQNAYQNELNSSVNYGRTFAGGKYNLSTSLRHNQNLNTNKIDFELPSISFNISRFYPFKRKRAVGSQKWYEKIGASYSTNIRNTLSGFDSSFFSGNFNEMELKNGMSHSIPITTSFTALKYFNFSPSISLNQYFYLKQKNYTWDDTKDTLLSGFDNKFTMGQTYNASLTLTTNIFGFYRFKSQKLKGMLHRVIPSVSVGYTPNFTKKSFGYYKTVQVNDTGLTRDYSIFEDGLLGGPSGTGGGYVNFNLGNSFEAKFGQKSDTGVVDKKVMLLNSLNFSTSYQINLDSFNWAPISLSYQTTILNKLNLTGSMGWDMYAQDKDYRRINKWELDVSKKLARLTFIRTYISYSFNPKARKKENERLYKYNAQRYPYSFVDFEIPWNLSINNDFNYYPDRDKKNQIGNILNFSGDLKLTDNWKIIANSGYDFKAKGISISNIEIHRDLHCWDFSFSWVPVGYRKSFLFSLKAKSSMLSDLKINKRSKNVLNPQGF